MNDLPNDEKNNQYANEIDLRELFSFLWSKVLYIGITTTIFSVISIIFALMLPNIYKSEALMMPTEENEGMGGMLQEYSGIASFAGISLPSDSSSKSQEAIARINSFDFFSNYFLPRIKLENLLAVKKWNQSNNTLTYDESIFNLELRQWVRKVKPPKSIIPSAQEAYKEYKEIMEISEDKKTLFVTLSIEHESPLIAQQWVAIIMDEIDKVMREKDRQTATQSIAYLNSITPSVNYEEIKKSLASLQEEQMKRLMMIEAYTDYIFIALDSPIVPELKFKPQRLIIVLLGTLLGIIISLLGVFYFYNSRKSPDLDKSVIQ